MKETIREAIENALEFIEAKHGHRNGAIYEDLAQALKQLEDGDSVDDHLTA